VTDKHLIINCSRKGWDTIYKIL